MFFAAKHNVSSTGGNHIVKKLLGVLSFACVLAFLPSILLSAQDKPEDMKAAPAEGKAAAEGKATKEARWEGIVVRSNKDDSTLTVRRRGTSVEKTVKYDSSTKWTSQEHGSKKVNDIDASQVNDNDRVICMGTWDKKGMLHATMISKRLTP
ncbi:MAG: hypothetical protein DMG88_19460 [Acidobacteria bacterium]|nr:MAG: hypothetical protein DMG88_19460 [Acidobacteriota bacterium]